MLERLKMNVTATNRPDQATPNAHMVGGGQDYDYQTAKKPDFSNLDQESTDKRNKTQNLPQLSIINDKMTDNLDDSRVIIQEAENDDAPPNRSQEQAKNS